ncbi:MAG: MerR family transcriptional regulator [Chloroflexota bacterium]
MDDRMRIGDLTERAGVTARTVRYYESIGLIPPGEREGNGQHYYTEETVTRLRKIDQLKQIGLSLEEIGKVIDLYFTDPTWVEAKQKILVLLRQHLAETDQKIGALEQFRADLRFHISRFEHWIDSQEHD